MDYSYLTGCFLIASSVSKGFGNLTKISLIFYLIICSAEAPDPPISLGNNINTVSHIVFVSIIAEEI